MSDYKCITFVLILYIFSVYSDNVIVNVIPTIRDMLYSPPFLPRFRRDVSDECKPTFPPPDHVPESCCELPRIFCCIDSAFDMCHEAMHKNPPDVASTIVRRKTRLFHREVESGPPNHPPHHHPPPPQMRNCMMECVFNASGYLAPDGLLNEDSLNKAIIEEMSKDNKWSPIGASAFRKCISLAKEASLQSNQDCKPIAADFMKCMTREMFLNCPSEIWINNAQCNELKGKLERCPNLGPPPPPPRPKP